MFVIRVLFVPLRAGAWATKIASKVGFRAGRISARGGRRLGSRAGWGRVALFGAGLLAGLLLSVVPGRALRRQVRRLMGSRGVSDDSVREAVVFELAHAPRTWHLQQPTVSVAGGIVTLQGAAAHETAREALERAARGVDGVADVVNAITLT